MRGILFTELLFNMTVRKQKTMTRREPKSLKVINENPDDWCLMDMYHQAYFKSMINGEKLFIKPTYKKSEVLYIKEPTFVTPEGEVVYKYEESGTPMFYKDARADGHRAIQWDNKLFMGSNKARYYIRITSIKCERLFSISDGDCFDEGVETWPTLSEKGFTYPNYMVKPHMDTRVMRFDFSTPQESFFSLFRFANRIPKSKEIKNVWAFCYSYVLCDKNGKEI